MLKGLVEWWFQHSQDLLSEVENGVGLLFFLSIIVVHVQIASIIATVWYRFLCIKGNNFRWEAT